MSQPHTLYGTLSEAFLFVPVSPRLLFLKFRRPGILALRPNPAARMTPVAWKGLHVTTGLLGHRIEADENSELLYSVEPQVRRGAVDPDACFLAPALLKKESSHLAENELLDFGTPGIAAAADRIRASLTDYGRRNAYRVVDAILAWMKENVRYTLLPASAVRRIAFVLSQMENPEKAGVVAILRNVLDASDEFLSHMARNAKLTPGLSPDKAAEDLVKQLDRELLQVLWLGDTGKGDELRASRTLENKGGKCVGITNLFVAMARALQVPAAPVSGFYLTPEGFGAGHAWALVHLGSEGLRECDPTMGEFESFSYSRHAYRFSGEDTTTLPDAQYLSGASARGDLSSCLALLKSRASWVDRLFRGRATRALHELEPLVTPSAT